MIKDGMVFVIEISVDGIRTFYVNLWEYNEANLICHFAQSLCFVLDVLCVHDQDSELENILGRLLYYSFGFFTSFGPTKLNFLKYIYIYSFIWPRKSEYVRTHLFPLRKHEISATTIQNLTLQNHMLFFLYCGFSKIWLDCWVITQNVWNVMCYLCTS